MALAVLIVEDHPIVRRALHLALLNAWPDAALFEADSPDAAGEAMGAAGPPDLVVLDLCFAQSAGLSSLVTVQRRFPQARIAVFSSMDAEATVASAYRLGAHAFLPKTTPLPELVARLRHVVEGRDDGRERDRAPDETPARAAVGALSAAQLRVLVALASGKRSAEIAAMLGVTEATVKAHLTAVYKALGVQSRTQAVLAARALGA